MGFFKRYILYFLLGLVLIIMLISLVLTRYNNDEIRKNLHLKAQAEDILQTNSLILREVLHSIDLGLRGFAITKNDGLLQPLRKASETSKEVFSHLSAELDTQKYDTKELMLVQDQVHKYMVFCNGMADDVRAGRMDTFLVKLNQDKGYFAWKAWDDHTKHLHEFEENLITTANDRVQRAMNQNFTLKVVLVLFSIPTFGVALYMVNLENKKRKRLLVGLELNNRKYLFNPNTDISKLTEPQILDASIQNMRQTAEFVKSVAAGNYENNWPGLNENNKEENEHTIAGELLQMQKQMREVKLADQKRLWANEGLTKFSEIIRNNQDNVDEMSRLCVSFLAKHLQGWQAGLYLRKEDEDTGKPYLQTIALYAQDIKKNRTETFYAGEGVIGQTYLDAKSMHIQQVPESYWQINSGLGTAGPTNVLVVPFQFNQEVRAVFEIASFHQFTETEITFLEKSGEYYASAISATKKGVTG